MEVVPRTRVDVFEDIFLVFLGLGTLVGIVVITYTLYNAYKYRDTEDRPDDGEDLPSVGELPTGGKGGKKLFLSFGLSAIIVISLVIWTYGMLLYVEDPGMENPGEEAMEIDVEGWAFEWDFYYENGVETSSLDEGLVLPADQPIWVQVTSTDVWHTFGIPDFRVKADAIPGEYDQTWFVADEPGNYTVKCFELCGPGHSEMTSDVTVYEQERFEEWMDEQLTMTITLEDEEEQRVTDGFELSLEHQNNEEFEEDLSYTFEDDEFENGSITIEDIEQGGPYDVEITFEGDEYNDVEDTIDFTGPTDETFTLETPGDEGEEGNGSDGGNGEQNESDSSDNDENTDGETTDDGGDGA